jgi:hypothetical protein
MTPGDIGMTFFVTIAEARTGIVIHTDSGARHREDNGDPRLAFDDERAAVDFSQRHVSLFTDRECLVTDRSGACLHVFRVAGNPGID